MVAIISRNKVSIFRWRTERCHFSGISTIFFLYRHNFIRVNFQWNISRDGGKTNVALCNTRGRKQRQFEPTSIYFRGNLHPAQVVSKVAASSERRPTMRLVIDVVSHLDYRRCLALVTGNRLHFYIENVLWISSRTLAYISGETKAWDVSPLSGRAAQFVSPPIKINAGFN